VVRCTLIRLISGNNLQLIDTELEVLYAEFANEDCELAESGSGDYVANLEREDMVK
jgi:hypothetical protein